MGLEKILYVNHTPRELFSVHIALSKQARNANLEQEIQKKWQEKQKVAKRRKALLWNGVVYRLNNWFILDGKLEIEVAETNYKDTVGTHENNPEEIVKKFGREYLANTLVITSSVVTSDDQLALGKRAEGVIEPNKYGTFGGSLDKSNIEITSQDDIVKSLILELNEELGIGESLIDQTTFLGLTEDYNYYPQLHFETKISSTFARLKELFSKKRDMEHTNLVAVKNSSQTLEQFIAFNKSACSGALITHARLKSLL